MSLLEHLTKSDQVATEEGEHEEAEEGVQEVELDASQSKRTSKLMYNLNMEYEICIVRVYEITRMHSSTCTKYIKQSNDINKYREQRTSTSLMTNWLR